MGKEKEKDKKDKDKDKDKKKDKDKDKDKDKKKDKDKEMPDQEWKIAISKNLDQLISAYGKIVKIFQDIDNYILKDAKTVEEFKEKVQKAISDLPEVSQNVFIAFLDTI